MFEQLLNWVIKCNKIQVPEGMDPLLCIPWNAILLNLSCDLKLKKPIISNQVKPKLHTLCESIGLNKTVYGYFIRRCVITWAARNEASPLLL